MHERLCKPLSRAPLATTLNSQDSKRLRRLPARVGGKNRIRGTGADIGLNRLAGRMNTGASSRKYDRVHWGAVLDQTGETILALTNERKCSSSSFGICPPEISTPASMFFSIACPVRFALVMKHVVPSATATLAWT